MLTVALAVGALWGCRGSEEEVVPEGEVRILADRTTFVADGKEEVTFKVLYGAEDVSNNENLQLIYTAPDGSEQRGSWGTNRFSTTTEGDYVFKAKYGSTTSSNSISITAKAEAPTGKERDYKRFFAGFQFTSLWCTGCPAMEQAIEVVQQQGVPLLALAFHRNLGGVSDPMTFVMDAKQDYIYACGSDGMSLPYLCIDLVKENTLGVIRDVYEGSEVKAIVDYVAQKYPSDCGVAIESSWDKAAGKVRVKAKITPNSSDYYNYQIVLVEDGVSGGDEVCNNVVRALSSPARYGHSWANGEVCSKCQESVGEQTLTIKPDWVGENMRIVVLAISRNRQIVVNCNQAPLGGSADYVVAQ